MNEDIKLFALLRDRLYRKDLNALAVIPFRFEIVAEDIIRGGNIHSHSLEGGRYYIAYYEAYRDGEVIDNVTTRQENGQWVYEFMYHTLSGTKTYEETDMFYAGEYTAPTVIFGSHRYVKPAAMPERMTLPVGADAADKDKVRAALGVMRQYREIEIHVPDDFEEADYARVRLWEVIPLWKRNT